MFFLLTNNYYLICCSQYNFTNDGFKTSISCNMGSTLNSPDLRQKMALRYRKISETYSNYCDKLDGWYQVFLFPIFVVWSFLFAYFCIFPKIWIFLDNSRAYWQSRHFPQVDQGTTKTIYFVLLPCSLFFFFFFVEFLTHIYW